MSTEVDTGNHRVLEYNGPVTLGEAAAVVLGQADMSSNRCNRGGAASAVSLCGPQGVAVDSAIPANLFVADTTNNRVFRYQAPLTTGMAATTVIGKTSFTLITCSAARTALCFPSALTLDTAGNLYVADTKNNRVFEYTAPFSATNMSASTVFWARGRFYDQHLQ